MIEKRGVLVVTGPSAVWMVRDMVPPRSRWPHHTTSVASMIGRATTDQDGIVNLSLGECVLASGVTLVLSDLPEWRHETLEAIGYAWRTGFVTVGIKPAVKIRADFDIIATCELCPCGMKGREDVSCGCSEDMLDRWDAKRRTAISLLEGRA